MAKRDYIQEIQEIKKRRLKRGRRWDQLIRRLYPLLDTLAYALKIENDDIKREVIRYSFICLIACLEGYFRLVIKDLVDKSEICRKNIQNINDLKFDIKSVLAINVKEVSIGEFVSHLVPLSSFEQLNKNLSTITDSDFMEELKQVEVKYEKEERRKMYSDTPKYVKKTYEFRNIYCHELSPKKEPTKSLFRNAFLCAIAIHDYLFATEVYIKRLIET